jgi:hypothetical protein
VPAAAGLHTTLRNLWVQLSCIAVVRWRDVAGTLHLQQQQHRLLLHRVLRPEWFQGAPCTALQQMVLQRGWAAAGAHHRSSGWWWVPRHADMLVFHHSLAAGLCWPSPVLMHIHLVHLQQRLHCLPLGVLSPGSCLYIVMLTLVCHRGLHRVDCGTC